MTFFCNSKDGEAFSYAEVWKVVNERSCTLTENGKIRKPTFFLVFSSLLNNFFNYSAISCFGLPDGKCGKSLCLKPLIVQSRPHTGSVTLIFAFCVSGIWNHYNGVVCCGYCTVLLEEQEHIGSKAANIIWGW